MKVLEIAFVGYPVTDLRRARGFYEGLLGLKPTHTIGDEKEGYVEYDIGANTLSIGNMAPNWKPSAGGGTVALEVDDFPAAVQQLKGNGIRFVIEPVETPVCHIAVVSDPDGNSVLIHKRKSR